jgi:PAS domain S-box-containing protein
MPRIAPPKSAIIQASSLLMSWPSASSGRRRSFVISVARPLPEGDWSQRRILRGEILSGSSAVETQAVSREGNAQWWSVSGAPLRGEDGTIRGAVLVNTDITQRKELEEALHRANERFEIAERAANGFVYEWNVRSGQLYRSAGVKRVLGYRAEEIPPSWDAWAQLVYPGDWQASTDAEELAFLEALPGDTLETEYRIRHRGGHYLTVALTVADHAALERDEAGHVIRLIGQTHDITERKRAEEALRESETRFRDLANHAPLFTWVSDERARNLRESIIARLLWRARSIACGGWLLGRGGMATRRTSR